MATATATPRLSRPRKPIASPHLRPEMRIPLAREGEEPAIRRESLLASPHRHKHRLTLIAFLLVEGEGRAVDAVSKSFRAGTVGKHMAKMAFAAGASNFGADHAVTMVAALGDGIAFYGGGKARPT